MEGGSLSIRPEPRSEAKEASGFSFKVDSEGQRHLMLEGKEFRLSQLSAWERKTFFKHQFEQLKEEIETELGEELVIVPSQEKIEIFIGEKGKYPDGGLEFQFVYPGDYSDVEIKYVYNTQPQNGPEKEGRARLRNVTQLLLAYLLSTHPKIQRIHSTISDTNLQAAKLRPQHPGRYAPLAQTPMYKARAALGFGKVDSIQGGAVTTTFF